MKLSQFGINKTIKFVNDEVQIEEDQINEINFYNLTYDIIESINNNVIQKLNGAETDEELTFKIIPYICDLEMDKPFEYFINLSKVPPKQFTYFLEAVIDIVNDLFDASERLPELQKKTEKLNSKMPAMKETKEQKLEKLYNELSIVGISKEKRKSLIKEISILESGE
jgi:hypothetical protein